MVACVDPPSWIVRHTTPPQRGRWSWLFALGCRFELSIQVTERAALVPSIVCAGGTPDR